MTDPSASKPRTSIAPFLSVRHGAQAIDFYKTAFGATELFRVEDEEGAVVAQLSVDGAEFWLADESPELQPRNPQRGTVRIVLTVEDPDDASARAIKARPASAR